MELDPDVEVVVDAIAELDRSLANGTVEEAREELDRMSAMSAGEPPEMDVEEAVIEATDAEIDARVYSPGADCAVVYYHGGGFVLGSLDSHDQVCRLIAEKSGCTVVSVDYRLAPEHPFPAGVKDAYDAAVWASGRYDSVAVAGDSAGGTLSAVTAMMARDRGEPEIAAQVLLYPVTAYDEEMPSRQENAEGYLLELDDMEWFEGHYIEDDVDTRNPYAFPLQARSLEGVAPAFVLTAGFDPLRDEGREYARRLEEDGVEVDHVEYEGAIHAFLNMDGAVGAAHDALDDVAGFLDRSLE